MLDIKMVRANPDLVKQAMKTRNKDMDAQVDRVIAIDAERRELSAKADGVKARQNAASKDIARLKKEGGDGFRVTRVLCFDDLPSALLVYEQGTAVE